MKGHVSCNHDIVLSVHGFVWYDEKLKCESGSTVKEISTFLSVRTGLSI